MYSFEDSYGSLCFDVELSDDTFHIKNITGDYADLDNMLTHFTKTYKTSDQYDYFTASIPRSTSSEVRNWTKDNHCSVVTLDRTQVFIKVYV